MTARPSSDPRLVWIDCETGGLDPDRADIISIHVETGDLVWARKWRPAFPVDPGAARVNGYTPEAWADADEPTVADLDELRALLEGRIAAGHFVRFDLAFIDALFVRFAQRPPRRARDELDTKALILPLRLAGAIESTGLSVAGRALLGLEQGEPHRPDVDVAIYRALYDAIATAWGVF